MSEIKNQAQACKKAERILACTGTNIKNDALNAIADALIKRQDEIININKEDVEAAKAFGMKSSMLDRLTLTPKRIQGMADGARQIAAFHDPIGEVIHTEKRPNGLQIGKRRVPLGVIGIIFEARPNVTVDAAAICLKSGNTCLLRGGKEAIRTNIALSDIIREALESVGLPKDCVCLVHDTSREGANEMMTLTDELDVLIPRGGRGLIRSVSENSKVPVIRTGEGVCNVYIDDSADLKMAADIIFNAKCSRPSVCNAAENLVVARSIAKVFLPMAKEVLDTQNVRLLGDDETCSILPGIEKASDEDWDTEYDDYILSIKVVSGLDEAIEFISEHSTHHSECIVTENYSAAQRFLDEIDSAAVYINASTRFTDGGEFGLGAEIGISTQKLHARGPMGINELTSIKYVIRGNGQVR